jgi:hypothetical protein
MLKRGVRGKYQSAAAGRYQTRLVGPNPSTDGFGPGASAARPYILLDPDVAAVFCDSMSMTQALRVLTKAVAQLERASGQKTEQT